MQLPKTLMLRRIALAWMVCLPGSVAWGQALPASVDEPHLSPNTSIRGMPEKVQSASAQRRRGAESLGATQLIAVRTPQDRPALNDPPAPLGPVFPRQDASPSDEPNTDQQSLAKDQNALAPIQNREMTIQVSVVDISVGGLGTGIIPEPAAAIHTSDPLVGTYLRTAAYKCVHWRSSQICHLPLYFEDAMLERHGHVRFGRLQPVASGVKFLTTIPLLPYLSTLRPCHEPVYALGQWRPGSCAPLVRDNLPWDARAAAVETLSAATFFWAAPL